LESRRQADDLSLVSRRFEVEKTTGHESRDQATQKGVRRRGRSAPRSKRSVHAPTKAVVPPAAHRWACVGEDDEAPRALAHYLLSVGDETLARTGRLLAALAAGRAPSPASPASQASPAAKTAETSRKDPER